MCAARARARARTSAQEEWVPSKLRRVDGLNKWAAQPAEEVRNAPDVGQGLLVGDEPEEEAARHEERLRARGDACTRE